MVGVLGFSWIFLNPKLGFYTSIYSAGIRDQSMVWAYMFVFSSCVFLGKINYLYSRGKQGNIWNTRLGQLFLDNISYVHRVNGACYSFVNYLWSALLFGCVCSIWNFKIHSSDKVRNIYLVTSQISVRSLGWNQLN